VEAAPRIPVESHAELYDGAPCGYLTTLLDGTIVRANARVYEWTGWDPEDLVDRRRFLDLLRVGSRIYYETHYAPMLQLQGRVADVALELVGIHGQAVPVIAGSVLVPAGDAAPGHIRTTLVDARGRQEFEQELVRARREAEESESRASDVARTLQRSLLHGGLTSGAGFVVETRYRPAVETLEVGGDWYDAFLVQDDVVAISVGDVVGRGLAAASAMGQVRSALRALSDLGQGPGPVLDRLDHFVGRVPGAWMATVAIVEVTPATGLVRYASAGHLPALVLEPDGATRLLWDGRSHPLAALPRDTPRPQATTTVPPGSSILLCTDGLIERHGRDIDEGLRAWADSATELRALPPAERADRMLADLLVDEDVRDDVCLVSLSLQPETASGTI
jgi:sigma-B regulation protein RsbU (phosphoserine phosphatase)